MPRISTGFSAPTRRFICKGCGLALKHRGDINRHTRSHDPAVEFMCPFENCCYSSSQKSNIDLHVNSMHECTTQYKCRFDPSCPRSYKHPSTRLRHEKTAHGYWHSSQKGAKISAKIISLEAVCKEETPSFLRRHGDGVKAEDVDCAALLHETYEEDKDAEDRKPTQEQAALGLLSNLVHLQTSSLEALHLRELQPASPGSAERPMLPGVRDILVQCANIGAYASDALNSSSSRTLPSEYIYNLSGDKRIQGGAVQQGVTLGSSSG